MKAVAGKLHCDRTTVARYERKYKAVKDAIAEERAAFADVAEVELVKAVKDGQAWAIGKVLSAFGRDRGYEPDGAISGKVTVEVVRRKRGGIKHD